VAISETWRHGFEEVAAGIPGLTAHLAGQAGANGIIRPRAPYDDQGAGHLAGEG
jgi:hypothetical protein